MPCPSPATLVAVLLPCVPLIGQAGQVVGQPIPATQVIRATPGLGLATDVAGACRDATGAYWTTCKVGNQILLVKIAAPGTVLGTIYTAFNGSAAVTDLTYDANNDNVWVLAAPNPPHAYNATSGLLAGIGAAGTNGTGIAWDGIGRIQVAGSATGYSTTNFSTSIGLAVPPSERGLLFDTMTGEFTGSRNSADPAQITAHEYVELPNGVTTPPNLRGVTDNGALGGAPRGCDAWQPPQGLPLGVFCVGGDNDNAVLYTARLSRAMTPDCGGARIDKGPAIVQGNVYVEAANATGPTFLVMSLARGNVTGPALEPGCVLGVDPALGVLYGPLLPQGGGRISVQTTVPQDPVIDELALWFQFGTLTLQSTFVLSETRGAAVKQSGTMTFVITETFNSNAQLDPLTSSGDWAFGGAQPGLIGGDGRHGSFDPTLGTQTGPDEYTWDTDNSVIPADRTLTGTAYTITDGQYYFTDFVIPANVTVRFIGSAPAVIRVRGQSIVEGTLSLDADGMETFNARGSVSSTAPFINGQPGGRPGAGGGYGGRGGDECRGTGPIIVAGENLTDGADGEDVRLLAGNAYVNQAVGSGGRGSTMNPPTGQAFPNSPRIAFVYRAFMSPGGGGGGYGGPGGTPALLTNPLPSFLVNLQYGTAPAASTPYGPYTPIGSSLVHYLVGGSGGGGGATHALGTIFATGDVYVAGSGGSGGGGACALRSGGDVTVAAGGECTARGGEGAIIDGRDSPTATTANWGLSSPGGGGSGGTLLLQSGGSIVVGGGLDTSGGNGSRIDNVGLVNVQALEAAAGAGAVGNYRLETNGSILVQSTGNVPAYSPAANSGTLTDRDAFVGQGSLWYSAGPGLFPTWSRYELDFDANGDGFVDITYTDSGAAGTLPAKSPTTPIDLRFQGANLDPVTGEPIPGSIGPWRDYVGSALGTGLDADSANGYRFALTFNRQVLQPGASVLELRVYTAR